MVVFSRTALVYRCVHAGLCPLRIIFCYASRSHVLLYL